MSLSIIIPGIRTHFWPRVVTSLESSIGKFKNDYEIIFISPFDLPLEFQSLPQIKLVKSYARVATCIQLGVLEATKDFIYHTVDDGIFIPKALENCLQDFRETANEKDMMNIRYSEGVNFQDNIRPGIFFDIKNCPEYHQKYINKKYSVSVQPLMYRKRFIDLGGMDCRFEYSNHSHIDLAIRLQDAGGKVIHSPVGVANFEHYPERTVDHAPIHDAQTNVDQTIFETLWNKPRFPYIDYNNYLKYNEPWKRRFGKLYNSYEEMSQGEGYYG